MSVKVHMNVRAMCQGCAWGLAGVDNRAIVAELTAHHKETGHVVWKLYSSLVVYDNEPPPERVVDAAMYQKLVAAVEALRPGVRYTAIKLQMLWHVGSDTRRWMVGKLVEDGLLKHVEGRYVKA